MQASEVEASNATTHRFPRVQRPLATGVLDLGLGAFHRAHHAYFFDQLPQQGHRDWGVAAVNLRSMEIVQNLSARDNVCTRWERGRGAEKIRMIGALTGSYHLPTMRNAVLDVFRNPATRLITSTVGEKGYHFDHQADCLDETHAEIKADLAKPSAAATLPRVLAQDLNERRKADAGPITIVSCDNYRQNGQVLKAVVNGFARLRCPELTDWLEHNASFPSSMVDGIVPRVREKDRTALEQRNGTTDPILVIVEDYLRWVIKDDFAGDRLSLDSVGAEIVSDVGPYETIKLLLLNGPHSAIAYFGSLAGFDYIYEAVAHPILRTAVDSLLQHELLPVAEDTAGHHATDYGGIALDHFANTNIEYRTLQVATDGSLKIQQRILPAISWHLSRGRVPDGLSLILAGWMRFQAGVTDAGERYHVTDPMAEALADCHGGAAGGTEIVNRFLAMGEIFPAEFSQRGDLAIGSLGILTVSQRTGLCLGCNCFKLHK